MVIKKVQLPRSLTMTILIRTPEFLAEIKAMIENDP